MAGDSKDVARAHLADAGVEELPDDWDVVTLGDLFTEDRGIAVGVMYPGDHDPDGVPLIKAGDLNGSIINPHPDFRISKDKHHEYRRTALEGGELLMTLVGNVGQCAVVPPRMAGWNTARAVAVMRLVDSSETHFVQQCLLSRPLQHLMDVWCNTTVQATLNLKEIRQLPLPWPPKQSRDAIAAFGKALDDKIELNRRMNATLEAMARALFQSWFVDFDPVRAKLDGRPPAALDPATAALFPDSLQDSAIGPIPHGWSMKDLGEIADFDKGLSYKGEGLAEEGGMPMVNLGCFTGRGLFNADRVKRYTGEYRERHLVHAGDLVIANTDMTQNRIIIGSPALVPELNGAKEFLFTHHVFAVRFKTGAELWRRYVFFTLLKPEFREIAEGFSTGTTVLALPRDGLVNYSLCLPPIPLLEAFEKQVGPILGAFDANLHQSRTLATLRDTLLPKLLSGEISQETTS